MRPGVAAGHPATAEVGAEILAEGGTAADAVVAMCLASCVAETVMSGLLAGCHAIAFDGSRVQNLDGFAAVPAGEGELVDVPVLFGTSSSCTRSGPVRARSRGCRLRSASSGNASGGCPGRGSSSRRSPCPWGVPLPEMHARSLEMLAGVFSLERGGELFASESRMLQSGDLLEQPGLVTALEMLAEEGAVSVYRGSLAEALLRVDGVVFTADDLHGYRARWRDPALVEFHGYRVATRGGLSGVPELLPRSPASQGTRDGPRPRPRRSARARRSGRRAHDEHGRGRRDRAGMRPDALTRCRRGRVDPRTGRAAEQPAGRVGHRLGDPRPGDRLESRMAPSWRSTATASSSRSARLGRPGCGPRSRQC